MDTILRINMSGNGGPTISKEPLGEYAGLGGRAFTSKVVSTEVPPTCHPLSADNKLVIAPGLLSGTTAAMSGRLSVGCKSPLTGGIKEANAGGQAGQTLARLGYAAIILEGAAPANACYKVLINKDGVQISDAAEYKGLLNYDLIEKIKPVYGEKVAVMSIGPAGEMKMAAATVAITDREMRPSRHAGRGGNVVAVQPLLELVERPVAVDPDERLERLTRLHENEVGHIHQVVNGPKPNGVQPVLKPER